VFYVLGQAAADTSVGPVSLPPWAWASGAAVLVLLFGVWFRAQRLTQEVGKDQAEGWTRLNEDYASSIRRKNAEINELTALVRSEHEQAETYLRERNEAREQLAEERGRARQLKRDRDELAARLSQSPPGAGGGPSDG
jgi:hypothetical protein